VLKAFINKLFCPESFNSDFLLNMETAKEHCLRSPDGRKREQFLDWIENLPHKGSPTWVGLPVHAEQMLRINRAQHTLSRWLMLQGTSSQPKGEKTQKRRASVLVNPLAELGVKVKQMLSNLPEDLDVMPRDANSLQDPLWRCYDREVNFGRSLLKQVRADLQHLLSACEGNSKTTNDTRQLIQELTTDQVPKVWKKFAIAEITVTSWLADFVKRLDQMKVVVGLSSLQQHKLWYGGLFFPEAFLTASRQAVAQAKQVSLEELNLVVTIGSSPATDDAFEVSGMYLEGAAWDASAKQLSVTDELTVALPNTVFRWLHVDSAEYKKTLQFLSVPVYLNTSRSILVTSFGLQSPKEIPNEVWVQRSVCVTIWTSA